MTEWYHSSPNYGNGRAVTYSPYGNEQSSGRLIVDEKYDGSLIFGDNSSIISYSGADSLNSHNISARYEAGTFTTGS
jgi:hypothetical protein